MPLKNRIAGPSDRVRAYDLTSMLPHICWLFLRGFVQVAPVNVSAYLVALIAGHRGSEMQLWAALWCSSLTISTIWWANSSAAKNSHRLDALSYGLGAACGTISGLAVTRWLVG